MTSIGIRDKKKNKVMHGVLFESKRLNNGADKSII